MPTWLQSWLPLVTPLCAMMVAFSTVSFTAYAFYRQRWWERKADAYTRLLEALYHVEAFYDLLSDEFLTGKDKDEKYKAGLVERYSDAYSDVRKIAALGRFYVSEDACSALKAYLAHKPLEWGKSQAFEWADDHSFAARLAIEKIRAAAMHDLKLESRWKALLGLLSRSDRLLRAIVMKCKTPRSQ